MISDQITLGSSSTYLLNADDKPNLGGDSPSTARTPKLNPNQIWDISGLELLIEGDDLMPLLHMPDVLDNQVWVLDGPQPDYLPGFVANLPAPVFDLDKARDFFATSEYADE